MFILTTLTQLKTISISFFAFSFFVDIQKRFEPVVHHILLNKLSHGGIKVKKMLMTWSIKKCKNVDNIKLVMINKTFTGLVQSKLLLNDLKQN